VFTVKHMMQDYIQSACPAYTVHHRSRIFSHAIRGLWSDETFCNPLRYNNPFRRSTNYICFLFTCKAVLWRLAWKHRKPVVCAYRSIGNWACWKAHLKPKTMLARFSTAS